MSTPYGDVREQLGASYVAQVVRSAGETWIASGNFEGRELRLTPLVGDGGKTKWRFEQGRAVKFEGAHGEEVVRDVLLDEGRGRVVSCGEDGMVRVWNVADVAGGEKMEVEEDEEEIRKEKKRRKKEKREKERFKPY